MKNQTTEKGPRGRKTENAELASQGWREGSYADFLDLTPEEESLVEMKLALSRELRRRRADTMTQTDLARKLGSSQSRVAKAEAADASVSFDLLLRALLATGATQKQIARVLAG